jgi:hypothetical protein
VRVIVGVAPPMGEYRPAGLQELVLSALRTIGWGFICLNLITLSLLLPSAEFLLFGIVSLASPVLILAKALLHYWSLTGRWWSVCVVAGAVGGVAGSTWLWFLPGHARLQNSLYAVAPAVYCLSWACVGIVVASAFGRGRGRGGRWRSYLGAVLAIALPHAGHARAIGLPTTTLPRPSRGDRAQLRGDLGGSAPSAQ